VVSQTTRHDGDKTILITMLAHTSGQFITSEVAIKLQERAQDLGSWLTYMRRYSLASILGIASDDDDDGAEATKQESRKTTEEKVKNSHDIKTPGEWLMPGGMGDGGRPLKGVALRDLSEKELSSFVAWITKVESAATNGKGRPPSPDYKDTALMCEKELAIRRGEHDQIPF